MTKTYKDLISDVVIEANYAESDWLAKIRHTAYDRFKKLGFPTRKTEDWKYTNIDKILKAAYMPSLKPAVDIPDPDLIQQYHLGGEEVNRMAFANGNLHDGFSSKFSFPKNVIFQELSSAIKEHPEKIKPYLASRVCEDTNAFAAINTFSFSQGAFLYIPDGQVVDAPAHILFAGLGDDQWPTVTNPRVLVVLGKDAKLNLLINHVTLNHEAYFMNSALEFYLGKGSKLHATIVQRQSCEASHFMSVRSYQEENSHLEVRNFAKQGDITHNDYSSHLVGENAFCDIRGLSLLAGHSQVSQGVWARHEASKTTSRQVFKNILAGHAQAEFNSTAHVYKGTIDSNSDQMNRNLILSDHARAYARPQLLIDADEVQAAHGSATGQLEDHEVFYLKSRGLDEETARYILTYGFAEEILSTVKPDNLRWQLELLSKQVIEAMLDPANEL